MRYYWAYKYNKDILSVSTQIEVVRLEEIVVLVAANGELILELATTQFVEFAHGLLWGGPYAVLWHKGRYSFLGFPLLFLELYTCNNLVCLCQDNRRGRRRYAA